MLTLYSRRRDWLLSGFLTQHFLTKSPERIHEFYVLNASGTFKILKKFRGLYPIAEVGDPLSLPPHQLNIRDN